MEVERNLAESGGHQLLGREIGALHQTGSRRAVMTLERTTWITIHVTEKTDLAEIEKEFIVGESE